MEWDACGVLDGQVNGQHPAAVITEAVLEGVPALHADRERIPSGFFGNELPRPALLLALITNLGPAPVVSDVGVEAGVEDEVAPVGAGRGVDRRRPVEPRVVGVWHQAATHIWRGNVEIDVHCCRIPTWRERLAVAAPASERPAVPSSA